MYCHQASDITIGSCIIKCKLIISSSAKPKQNMMSIWLKTWTQNAINKWFNNKRALFISIIYIARKPEKKQKDSREAVVQPSCLRQLSPKQTPILLFLYLTMLFPFLLLSLERAGLILSLFIRQRWLLPPEPKSASCWPSSLGGLPGSVVLQYLCLPASWFCLLDISTWMSTRHPQLPCS